MKKTNDTKAFYKAVDKVISHRAFSHDTTIEMAEDFLKSYVNNYVDIKEDPEAAILISIAFTKATIMGMLSDMIRYETTDNNKSFSKSVIDNDEFVKGFDDYIATMAIHSVNMKRPRAAFTDKEQKKIIAAFDKKENQNEKV